MKWLLQIGCVSNFLIKSSHYIVTLIENIRVDNDVRYIDIERYNNNVDVLVLSENVKSKSKNLFEKFKSQALDDTSGSFNFVKYYYQKIINFIRWIFYCDSHNGIYDNKRVLDTLDLLVCVLDKTFFENAQFLKIYSKLYDVDEKTPGNGYRSLNMTLGLIMIHINDCVTEIYQCKSNVCNLKSLLKLGVYTKVVIQLKASVHYLKQFTLYFSPNVEKSESKICLQNETIHINQIMKEIEVISQEKYFGDSIGFQYHPTIINIVRIITFGMAVTAKSFLMKAKHEPSNSVVKWITIFTSFVCARNYRELASNRITTATREGRLDFLLQFWNLYELGVITYTFSCLIIQPKVDKVFEIWYNKISVKTRLISRVLRKGQDRNNVETGHDLSNGLIFHCHGGGFISQSSLSHKVYLCEWSNKVGVPIFSVDYSLAIEKEFPNQIFEVVAAYEWALENKEKLGWNGKILLAVGDSAGANIIFGSIILLILQKKRIPDAIFSHYGVFNINWTPSPSRVLSLMDPILSYGVLFECLLAYKSKIDHPKFNYISDLLKKSIQENCRVQENVKKVQNNIECICFSTCSFTYTHHHTFSQVESLKLKNIPKSPFISPAFTPPHILKQFCPVYFYASNMDPLLDDTIHFARRCKEMGLKTETNIVKGLPHGYLNFILISKQVKEISKMCILHMINELQL